MVKIKHVSGLAFGLTFLAAACGGGDVSSSNHKAGEPCSTNEQCQAGLLCYHEVCRTICSSNQDCNTLTEHCEDDVCLPGSSV